MASLLAFVSLPGCLAGEWISGPSQLADSMVFSPQPGHLDFADEDVRGRVHCGAMILTCKRSLVRRHSHFTIVVDAFPVEDGDGIRAVPLPCLAESFATFGGGTSMGVSPNWMVFVRENPIEMDDDIKYPMTQETPIDVFDYINRQMGLNNRPS